MPHWNRYWLPGEYPRILRYRNAEVELEIVSEAGIQWTNWSLRARKRELGGGAVELASTRYGREYLEGVVLPKDGFTLEAGTPAARVMDYLVRLGWARREECR